MTDNADNFKDKMARLKAMLPLSEPEEKAIATWLAGGPWDDAVLDPVADRLTAPGAQP